MTSRNWTKVISGILAATLVIQILPFSAIAAELDTESKGEEARQTVSETGESLIVGEDIGQRDTFEKVFARMDGTQTKIQSAKPLHYKKDGKWMEIDNTLYRTKNASGQTVLKNKSGLFDVELPECLTDSNEIWLQKDGHVITMTPKAADSAKRAKIIKNKKEVTAKTEVEKAFDIQKTTSNVVYRDFLENADLQYSIQSDGIKENVVLKQRPSETFSYSFTIRARKMEIQKKNDNSIEIMDEKKNKVFVIPAPVMYDAQNYYSETIKVDLSPSGEDTYLLTYSPSLEWLTEKGRSYPVVVDPAVRIGSITPAIEDTSISDGMPNQNYYNALLGGITGNGEDAMLLKLNGSSENIVNARLTIYGGRQNDNGYARISAHKITSDWNPKTVTYATRPSYDPEIIDFVDLDDHMINADVGRGTFDLTSVFADWSLGKARNYGIYLKSACRVSAACEIVVCTTKVNNEYVPVLEVTTRNAYGLNDYDNYHSMSAGDAGKVYLNDYTQNPVIVREDIGLPGNIMPVTIKMIYTAGQRSMYNPYGLLWKTNYHQSISFTNNGFVYRDETGAPTFYSKDKDAEDGRQRFLQAGYVKGNKGGDNMVLVEKGVSNYRDYSKVTVERADGTELRFDARGRLASINEQVQNGGKHHSITVDYVGDDDIKTITDGVGRIYLFNYEPTLGGLSVLKSIECLNADLTPITYQTDDGQIVPMKVNYTFSTQFHPKILPVSVAYPDGRKVNINMQSDGSMELTASNKDKFTLKTGTVVTMKEEMYNSATDSMVLKHSLEVTSDSSTQKRYKDETGATEIVQYDYTGKAVSKRQSGEPSSYAKGTQEPVNSSEHKNLIENGEFSNGLEGWSKAPFLSKALISLQQYRSASRSCQFGFMNRQNPYWIGQTLSNVSDGEYTFSGYFHIADGRMVNGTCALRLRALDKTGTVLASGMSEKVSSTNGEWKLVTVTVSVPLGTDKVVAEFGTEGGEGDMYVDDLSLICVEPGELPVNPEPQRKNYIKNGDFTIKGSRKETAADWSYDANINSRIEIEAEETRDQTLDNNVFQLRFYSKFANKNPASYQDVVVNGKKGEYFTLAGWSQSLTSNSPENDNSRYWGIKVEAPKGNGTYELVKEVKYQYGVTGWQYGDETFKLDRDIAVLRVSICYLGQYGNALFDGLQLYKESMTAAEGATEPGNCSCPKCTFTDCPCRCSSEAACTCAQCKRYTDSILDANGNITEEFTTDGTQKTSIKKTYTANGNYLKTSDGDGYGTKTYLYDDPTGMLKEMNGVQYQYGKDKMPSVISQKAGAMTLENRFTYKDGQIETLRRNGMEYRWDYNVYGGLQKFSLGSRPLITTKYQDESQKLISSMMYANGQTVRYRYNENGELTGVSYDNGASWRIELDYKNGRLVTVTDRVLQLQKRITQSGFRIADLRKKQYVYICERDKDGNLKETTAGHTYTSKVDEAKTVLENGHTQNGHTLSTGQISLAFTSDTDYFGRTVHKTLNALSAQQSVSYGYLNDSKSGGTTKVVNSYQDILTSGKGITSTSAYQAEYNSSGNLTGILCNGVKQFTYAYDEAGQLVSETDHSTGIKTDYQYDNGGNRIKTVQSNASGAATQTRQFDYGNAEWADLLSSVDGKPITYDSIGNPLSYDGWTFTWEAGRLLQKMEKGSTSLEYGYNSDNLRTKKTVTQNGVVTSYTYHYNEEGQLVSQDISSGTKNDNLYFFYDDKGSVSGFIHNGSDVYFYRMNMQGDIVGITKSDGTQAASYQYDAFGNLKSSAGNLAQINPLRYRGYQFDNETGLYYLKNRYYNSEWGRFLGIDDRVNTTNLLGGNLFLYCFNNPLKYTDPKGTSPESDYFIYLLKLLANILVLKMALNEVGQGPLLNLSGEDLANPKGFNVNESIMYSYITGGVIALGIKGSKNVSLSWGDKAFFKHLYNNLDDSWGAWGSGLLSQIWDSFDPYEGNPESFFGMAIPYAAVFMIMHIGYIPKKVELAQYNETEIIMYLKVGNKKYTLTMPLNEFEYKLDEIQESINV